VIVVVDYDPAWPQRFEVLRAEYAQAAEAACLRVIAIEHVGSTSVPALAAKPLIDCDIVVSEGDVTAAERLLVDMGFTSLGELGIPLRWAFAPPDRLVGTNTYVTVDGCLSLRNHIAVRDTLRANPELRDEYAAVKKRLAASAANMDEYGQGKDAIVHKILAEAGFSDAERASIKANQMPPHDDPSRSRRR
jgi:GrpB-like predicted nucleotidyltransferase (UPF0157 family)